MLIYSLNLDNNIQFKTSSCDILLYTIYNFVYILLLKNNTMNLFNLTNFNHEYNLGS